jgi:hypothetical protein
MPKYLIKFGCNFLGDYGYEVVEADEPPDEFELYELAVEHFMPEAEIIEVEDDDEEEE